MEDSDMHMGSHSLGTICLKIVYL